MISLSSRIMCKSPSSVTNAIGMDYSVRSRNDNILEGQGNLDLDVLTLTHKYIFC